MSNPTIISKKDEVKIGQWNAFPLKAVNKRVHDVFADRVKLQPDAEAVCAHDGSLSYAELDDVSTRLAHYLVDNYHVAAEDFIPLLFDKSLWNVVSMLAVLKAGAAFVPLDPTAPISRIESLCQRLNPPVVLCTSDHAITFSGVASQLLSIDAEVISYLPVYEPIPRARWDDFRKAAFLIFTSGSTGEAKGVIIEHAAFATSASHHGPTMFMDASSRVLQFAAHTFDASIQEILTTLLVGGCVCIPDEHSRMNNIAGAINEMSVNWACLTPSVVDFIDPADVPGLHTLILVGEAMSQSHIATWAPRTRLINGYGPTETTIAAIANPGVTADTHPLDIGLPLGVHVWIVDPEDHHTLVPIGSIGELLIQGPTLARGYLNDAVKTADSFIQAPSWSRALGAPGPYNRIYKTGDLVRQNADGSLRFVGRKDTQVKIHGQRVELGEIEHHINLDDAVKHCLVMLPKAGPFKGRLVSFVSLHKTEATTNEAEPIKIIKNCSEISSITERLQSQIPAYMIPFMLPVESIPRQTSGKLDRKRVNHWLESMDEAAYQQLISTANTKSGIEEPAAQPKFEIETILQAIWARVLNLPAHNIGVDRSFLSLGGDSISAMQVIGHCSKQNLALSVQDVLKARSITEVASRTKASKKESYTEVIEEEFDLSPIQQLFFSLPNQGKGHFNQSFYLRVTRPITLNNLRTSIEAILNRHSMLRARFTRSTGPIKQRVTENIAHSYRLQSHRISAQADATSIIEASQMSLDPFQGPLFAVDLFTLRNGGQLLFMVGHHLVIDLVSWRNILEEVEDLLTGFSLPVERPLPFQTWCRLQQEHSETFDLAKALPKQDIPAGDFKFWGIQPEQNTYGNVLVEGFEIDSSVTSQFLYDCHTSLRTEPIDILLSALLHSFAITFSDRHVPALYTEGHGREPSNMDVNLSKMVGWFTTLYPVCISGSGILDPVESVRNVKDFRRRVADNGRPYFATRSLTPAGKERFKDHWPLEITFNYLGQYQQLEREGALLTPVEDMAGEARGSGGLSDVGFNTPRFGLFEISAVIVQGKLRFSFTYNRNIKHQDRILMWISACRDAITTMTSSLSQMAPQFTLSDFPMLPLTYDGLNKILCDDLPRRGIDGPQEVEAMYPCSTIQDGLLISQSRNPDWYEDGVVYQLNVRNGEMLSSQRLINAWNMVVQRHSTLRTLFMDRVGERDGIYDQIVLKNVVVDVLVRDCRDENEALGYLGPQSPKSQTDNDRPPHKFTICRTANSKLFCKLEISHTIIDGESMSVIFHDLALAYQGQLTATPGPLYSEYVSYLQGLSHVEGINYWKSYLAGVEPCNFPILNDGIVVEKELCSIRLEFESSKFSNLQKFCEDKGFTMSNVLHAAWALTLRLYTGAEETIFGYLSSSRDIPLQGLEGAVGPYINMLACRLRIYSSTTLLSILKQVQDDYVESLPHKHTSLAEVQNALQLSGTVLFNTSLSYRRLPTESTDISSNVSFTQCFPTYDPTEYPISINIESSEHSAAIDLDYWTDHISRGQATNIGSTFLNALQNIFNYSDCTVAQFNPLGEENYLQILSWNKLIPVSVHDCVHKVIQRQARLQPNAPAINGWDANFTYAELDELSSKLATHLAILNAGPEVMVPVCFEKSSWTIIAMVAILKAGAAAVPLDPKHPKAALELRIRDTKAHIVLTAPHLSHLFEDAVPHVVPISSSFLEVLPVLDDEESRESVQPTNPCFVIYTSGSTGQPKGVVLEHRNFVTSAYAHGSCFGFGPSTRTLQFSAYTFDNSLEDIFTTLIHGGCVCVPSEQDRFTNLAGIINELDVNFMDLTPTVASFLHPSHVPNVKGVCLGGEPLTKENIETWGPAVRLHGCYGPSECAVNSTWNGDLGATIECTNLGRAIGSVSWVVDPTDHNILLPIGCTGELLLEGPIVARGYLNDSTKTAASFITDPAWATGGGRRMYKTGDLVRYNSDGTMTYLGRRDSQVKLNGQRLELGEIEHHVKRSLPSEIQSVVELVKPKIGAKALAVFFSQATRAAGTASISDIQLLSMDDSSRSLARNLESSLTEALPKYMIPTMYIPVSSMPMTASEKVDRRKLRTLTETLAERQATSYRLAKSSSRKPSSDTEKRLAALWETVLKREKGSVGADDDFFEVGGDSIAAMRLITAARHQGIFLSVTGIFRRSTLSALAKEIDTELSTPVIDEPEEVALPDSEPFALIKSLTSIFKTIKMAADECQLDPEVIEDIYPASPLQGGLVALATKTPGAYVARNIYQLPSNIDTVRFKEAWARVFADEGILRTRVVHVKDMGFLQVVVKEPLLWQSYSSLPNIPEVARQLPAHNGGHLSTYAIVGENTKQPKFVWTAHHAIYDGWCIPILFERVEAYYRSTAISSLPTIPYSRFIRHLTSIPTTAFDAFWLTYLANISAAPYPALPHPTYQVQATSLAKHNVPFTRPANSRITLASTIRAAWALTIGVYSGSNDDVCFGEILAGRDLPVPGITEMLGPMLATVPTRISISGKKSITEYLQGVQVQSAEVVQYQHAGLQHIKSLGGDCGLACEFQNVLVINGESTASEGGLFEILDVSTAGTNFSSYPLAAVCDIQGGKLNVEIHYDPFVIDDWEVERVVKQFDHFLQIVSDKARGSEVLGRIARMNPSDEATIQQWNAELPKVVDRSINHTFENQVRFQPVTKTAVDSFDSKFTYRELDKLSTRLAQHLLEREVNCDIVPFCFEKSAWAVVAMLAVLKAGKAFVPLDPAAPVKRLQGIVEDIEADVILCSPRYQELSQGLAGQTVVVDSAMVDFLPPTGTKLPRSNPDSPAYVIFTSGSTGKPKGTIVSHAAFSSSAASHGPALHLSASSRALQFASYTFDVSLMEILTTLTLGGCVCVPDEVTRLNNISLFIAEKQITWAALTPTFASMIDPASVPTLKTLCLGGEPMGKGDIEKWNASGRVNLVNAYGPSECAVTTTANSKVVVGTDPSNIGFSTGSRTWIVDPSDHNKLAPVGSVGELLIEGPLAKGYLNDEAKTKEVFIENPEWLLKFTSGTKGRFYKTGDLVRYLADGSMLFVKRKDTQTKVHGQRMELGEVEHFLRDDPSIRHVLAAVPKNGHCKTRLVAILSLKDVVPGLLPGDFKLVSQSICASYLTSIRERLCDRLPVYMIPSHWLVVEKLPILPSGKLDRRTTSIWVEEMSDETYRLICDAEAQEVSAPGSDVEKQLQNIWAETLNLPAEKIGLHKSFIHLGGDSISAMQVMSRCRADGLGLTVQNILQAKSITQLALLVSLPVEQTVVEETVNEIFDLSPIQKLYFDAVTNGEVHFNQSTVLRLSRRIEPVAIGQAIGALVKAHSMLRARFSKSDTGVWQQRVIAPSTDSCRIQSRKTTRESLASLVEQSQKSLDIENGPTFAADLFDLGGEQVLSLIAHHLIIDVVSWRVIIQDLEDMLTSGKFEVSKTLSFQSWTKAQVRQVESIDNDVNKYLENVPIANFDYWGMQGKPNGYGDVTTHTFKLDHETSTNLLGACEETLHTEPVEIFIAATCHALQQTFSDLPGIPAIYNEGHGREPWNNSGIDLSRTVGWFTTICPLYLPSNSKSKFKITDIIRWVKDLRSRIPAKGREYFDYRYLTQAGQEKFSSHWPMEITFNYLGKLQQLERSDSLLQPIQDFVSSDSDIGAAMPRFSLLDISVAVVKGRVQFSVSYNKQMKHQSQLCQFVQECKVSLEAAVDELLEMKPQRTLSDFPLLPLSLDGLDRLEQKLSLLRLTSLDDIEDAYPCSAMQQGILLSQSKSPDLYAYASILKVRSPGVGRIDPACLAKGWEAVVQQHATMRTAFIDGVCHDGELGQVVLRDFVPRVIHLRCKEREVQNFLSKQASLGFSEPVPPHRLIICQTDTGNVFCKLEMSHAVSDGTSLPILLADLSKAYQHFASGNRRYEGPAPPLYSDYIAHIGKSTDAAMKHWKSYLTGIEPCRLPPLADGLKKELNEHKTHLLELQGLANLRSFCSEHGITTSNILQLAWGLILKLYTGSDEVSFGYLTSGRDAPIPGLQDRAVGAFINMLVCRIDFTTNTQLSEALKRIQSDFTKGTEHQSVSLADVQHELQFSGTSLFNTAFSFQNRSNIETAGENVLQFDILDTHDPSEYDVGVNVEAFESRIEVNISYWTNSLSEAQATNIAHTFEHIVQTIISCSNGQSNLSDLNFFGSQSRQQIMTWNSTLPNRIEKRIQDLIQEQQRNQPRASQAVCSWDLNLTYSELDEMTTSLAIQLVRMGVGPEVYVPICFEKSTWAVVGILAILKAGGAFVPLDAVHPQNRLKHIITDVGASLILCSPEHKDKFKDIIQQTFVVDATCIDNSDGGSARLPAVKPNHAALILFTSGTTGQPKGTIIEHGSFCTGAVNHAKGMHIYSSSRVLQFASLTFDAGIMEILTTLIVGGCVCIPNSYERMNDIPGAMQRMDVNWMFATPSLASTLIPKALPSLRTMILGGEAVSAVDIAKWKGRICLIDGYGPSEASICTTANVLLGEGGIEMETGVDNIGYAVQGRTWVVHPNNQELLMPIGAVGELIIEGRGVAREYLNNPEKTAAAFIAPPAWLRNVNPRERLYKTGDLVRYNSDGSLNFISRKDNQIKLNGQRIELAEIEHHVKANLPKGTDAAVELVSRGKVKALAAFFVPQLDDQEANVQDDNSGAADEMLLPMSDEARTISYNLDASLAGTLPSYMIPTLFIPVTTLPLKSASGKLDRGRLRDIVKDMPGDLVAAYRLSSKINKRAPKTPMEKKLQKLWESVLSLKSGSVGAEDTFFRLGGDSITAMRLVVAARAEGIPLDVVSIFRSPKLSDMASLCTKAGGIEDVTSQSQPFSLLEKQFLSNELLDEITSECKVRGGQILDAYPCSPLQEALITLSIKEAGAYVAHHVFQLGADINLREFKAAWERVVGTVDILRTRVVHTQSSQFLQVVLKGEPITWDLAQTIDDARERGMNLPSSNGAALSRFTLVNPTSRSQRYFVWSIHHSLYDGWSLPSVLNLVETAYTNGLATLPSAPYSSFVRYLSESDVHTSDEFWKAKLAGASPAQFPQAQITDLDHVRQIKLSQHSMHLPASIAKSDVTISSFIRGAWSLVVAAHSGSDDVVFGEVLAGRDISVPDIQDILGPTIAIIPNRVQIDRQSNVHGFLSQVQKASTDVIPFQHAGLQRIKSLDSDNATACDFRNLLVIQPAGEETKASIWKQYDDGKVASNFSTYPLMVECHAGSGKIEIMAYFDKTLLSSWTVERLLFQLESTMKHLISSPKQILADIEVISTQDMELVKIWNAKDPEVTNRCLHAPFEQHASKNPRATAVSAWDGELTYGELRSHAIQLAHHLVNLGVGPENFVPICMDRSMWVVVAIMGILMSGGAYVPLDPSSPLSRHEIILKDTKADLVLCSPKYSNRFSGIVNSSMVIDENAIVSLRRRPALISPRASSTNAAYVIYTSGSTGTPKGVVIEHRSISTSIWGWRKKICMPPTSRVFHFGSLAFDASLLEIFGALTYGATVCIPSEDARLSNLAESINQFKATWTFITPSLANILEPSEVPTLEVMACGGEALAPEIIDKWTDKIKFIEVYGPTECAVLSTENSRVCELRNPLNIGRAFLGHQTWVVDARDHNKLAPLGSIGELLIEGAILSREYLNNPAKTAEVYINDPAWSKALNNDNTASSSISRRLYKTGDLVKYDHDGSIIFIGRKDNQVKLRGQRIELDEIEFALSKNSAVRHGIVMVPKSGPFKKRLVAVVSLNVFEPQTTEGRGCTLLQGESTKAKAIIICAKIRDQLSESLPRYMVPDSWLPVDSVPLTTSGKSERGSIVRWLEGIDQSTYEEIISRTESAGDEDLTGEEEVLQKLVARVLNLPPTAVKLQSSFLGLGGDSITAMQLLALCRKENIQLTLPEVLRSKTLCQLASTCRQQQVIAHVEEKFDQGFPLSPIQQMYFDSQTRPDQRRGSRFNQSFLLKLSKPVQPHTMKNAIEELVKYHSMLRARFSKSPSSAWQQRIPSEMQRSYRFSVHDVDYDEDIAQFIDISQNSLDITRGPVFSVDLFGTPHEQIIFLAAHHAVVDMVSWRIILQDLEDILTSGKMGAGPSLSFQGWLAMQTEESRKPLKNGPCDVLPTELPSANISYWGIDNQPNTYGDTVTESFTLSQTATTALFGAEVNKAMQTEPLDLFLAATAHSFSRVFSERECPTIFNESHGREAWDAHIDLSRTVGWFTTLCPLHVEVKSGNSDVLDTIRKMKDMRNKVPGNGRPYLAYRFLNSEGRKEFKAHDEPMEIMFNYLGRTQQLEREDSLLQQWTCPIDPEDTQMLSDVGPRTGRLALIEISAVVVEDKLRFSFVFNRHMERQQDIRRWISTCKDTLGEVIRSLSMTTGHRVLTLSDFPLLPLSYDGLEKLTNDTLPAVGITADDVEDIYPCAPMQEGMLLGQLRDPEFYQFHTILEVKGARGKKVDANRLASAWQQVVNRHPMLRTIFVDSVYRGDVFNQVVVKKIERQTLVLHCEDADALTKIENLTTSDTEDEDLDAPLLPHHFVVFQTSRGRVFAKLEMNHAIMDASSLPILFQDLVEAYEGTPSDKPAGLYSNYIAYLKKQPPGVDIAFWKSYLQGVKACHFPPMNADSSAKKVLTYASLSFDRFAELQAWCKARKLTLANVMQAVWAICLRHFTKSRDVSFGYLASGRDLPVEGIQETVGPFINMLVCRVNCTDNTSLEEIIENVQSDYLHALDHQHTSLAQVQHELKLSGAGLFNTAVSIQGSDPTGTPDNSSISFKPIAADDPTEYALTLSIGVVPKNEGAVLRYWTDILSPYQAETLLETLADVLDKVISKPSIQVSNIAFRKVSNEAAPPPQRQSMSQPEEIRTIVKECVTEIMSQILSSGAVMNNTPIPMMDSTKAHPVPVHQEPKQEIVSSAASTLESNDEMRPKLLSIWAEFLQVSENSISSDDSFFSLGGDSIVAMKMVGAAREEGISLTVADVFRCPVFEDMLEVIRLPTDYQPPKPARRESILEAPALIVEDVVPEMQPAKIARSKRSTYDKPLPAVNNDNNSVPQRRTSRRSNRNIAAEVRDRRRSMYEKFSMIQEPNVEIFLQESVSPKVGLFKGGIIDVLPATDFQALSITGSLLESRWMLNYFYLDGRGVLDIKQLRNAVNHVVDAFEILRTVFIPYNGQFFQVVLRKLVPRFDVETVDNLDEITMVLRQRDQENGPRPGQNYLQFTIAKLQNTDRHRIFIRISHAQYDGVCLPLILNALKTAFQGGSIPPSPSFTAYVRDAIGKTTNDHYRYWKSLLQGSKMTDIVARRGPNYGQGSNIPTMLRRKVRMASLARNGITPATIIKGAWSLVLAQMSRQSDIIFGNVISGRNVSVPGLENIVGPCVNTVPIRVPFRSRWTALDLLRHLQEQQVNNMPYESMGFREIIKNCTTWPDWTNFTTVCQHQNVETKPKISIGDIQYEFSGVGSQEDFADFSVFSVPQENGLDIEICLIFSLANIGMTKAATNAIFDNLCDTAEDFSRNPDRPLPSPADIIATPRFARDYTARKATAKLGLSLSWLKKSELLLYTNTLIRSWRQVLGDPSISIGPETSFFDLGGDIMGLAQVLALLEIEGFKVRLEDLVGFPVLREQVGLLARFVKMEEEEDFGDEKERMRKEEEAMQMQMAEQMQQIGGLKKALMMARMMLKSKPKGSRLEVVEEAE